MSKEQYIHGKKDDGKHDGRYASVRHLAETDEEVIEFWQAVWSELLNYVLHGVNWHDPPKVIQKEPDK